MFFVFFGKNVTAARQNQGKEDFLQKIFPKTLVKIPKSSYSLYD